MKTKFSRIAMALGLTTLVSAGIGAYFDSQCEVGCLIASAKASAEKAKSGGENIHISFDDDDHDRLPQIAGPLDVRLPQVAKLEHIVFKGVSSEVLVRRADKLAVRAFDYRTDKEWDISGSENRLNLDFQDRGPGRLEIDLPPDFKGRLNLTTVSGNLDVVQGLEFQNLEISTTSGDVKLESYPNDELTINTVSGDVETRKANELGPKKASFNAVSGDLRVELGSAFNRIKANTVSGDMQLTLVGKKPEFEYRMHSISGDFNGIPGGVVKEGIANKEMDGKVGEPKDTRLEFESISGDFQMTL